MLTRDQLIKFIFDYFGEDFIEKAKKVDNYVNGIQVLGSEDVSKVALGVSANIEFFEKCLDWGANFIIVHHGISLDKTNHYLNPILKERLKLLFDNDITLLAFHYLLDAHPKIGNNAQILRKIGAKTIKSFYDEWGWVGALERPKARKELIKELEKIFGHPATEVLEGPKEIKKLAVVSGGGTPHLYNMPQFLENDIDLYITGDIKESTPALFKEAKINYVAFGHYDTEKFGVMALGDLIKEKFPALEVKFIDTPNPY